MVQTEGSASARPPEPPEAPKAPEPPEAHDCVSLKLYRGRKRAVLTERGNHAGGFCGFEL